MQQSYALVVIGTSWGGLHALSTLIHGLPDDFALPIAIVQHRGRDAGTLLGELLQDRSALPVCEIEDKSPFRPGTVYVAPPDYHVLVEQGHFSLSLDEPVRYSRPSIDVAFSSAVDTYGSRTVGIVLTGANADGAVGLKRIADRGGVAIIQRPDEAESPIMPEAARQAVPSAIILSLAEMPGRLVRLTESKTRAVRQA